MNSIFLFLFLILFPFGQIVRIGIIQPVDLVAGLAACYVILKRVEIPDVFKRLRLFLIFAASSWFFSIFIFRQVEVLYGLLYLFRLAAYFYFGVYVWNFVKDSVDNKKLVLNSLLTVSVVSALFGWVQLFTFPDLKPFFVWGWDMHLFRVAGTFLDPTFLALIIVFGSIITILQKKWYLTVFLLISLAFTYSRAGYLAFIAGVMAIVYFEKRFKKLLLLIPAIIIVAFLLPTTKNHSIELFRSFSALSRIENYQTTLKIFSKSPVFGIGYNNMCLAYQKYIGPQDFSSHACSGSDSSILFVLATTGVIGLIVFVFSITGLAKLLPHNAYYLILMVSFIALLVHSLFGNSMFYPWIMGWIYILLAEV